MQRLTVIAALVLAALGWGAAPASAQYPPGAEETTVSDTTIVPGQDVTISSSGWQPGSQVTAEFASRAPVVLARAQVGSAGSFTVTVSIPADAAPGDHVIRLVGTDADGSTRVDEIPVRIVAPGGASRGGQAARGAPRPAAGIGLPATGAQVTVATALAAVLLLGGGVALYVTRKKAGAPR